MVCLNINADDQLTRTKVVCSYWFELGCACGYGKLLAITAQLMYPSIGTTFCRPEVFGFGGKSGLLDSRSSNLLLT